MIALGHTNIRVADLAKSVKFYEDAFGLEVIKKIENDACEMVWMCDERQFEGEDRDIKDSLFFLEIRHDKGHGAYDLGENSTHVAFVTDKRDVLHILHDVMGIIDFELDNGIYFVNDPDGYSVEVMPREFVKEMLKKDD